MHSSNLLSSGGQLSHDSLEHVDQLLAILKISTVIFWASRLKFIVLKRLFPSGSSFSNLLFLNEPLGQILNLSDIFVVLAGIQ